MDSISFTGAVVAVLLVGLALIVFGRVTKPSEAVAAGMVAVFIVSSITVVTGLFYLAFR